MVIIDSADGTVLTETEELLLNLVSQTSMIDEIRVIEDAIDTLQTGAQSALSTITADAAIYNCPVIIPQRGTVLTTNYILSQMIDVHTDPRSAASAP